MPDIFLIVSLSPFPNLSFCLYFTSPSSLRSRLPPTFPANPRKFLSKSSRLTFLSSILPSLVSENLRSLATNDSRVSLNVAPVIALLLLSFKLCSNVPGECPSGSFSIHSSPLLSFPSASEAVLVVSLSLRRLRFLLFFPFFFFLQYF